MEPACWVSKLGPQDCVTAVTMGHAASLLAREPLVAAEHVEGDLWNSCGEGA